MFVSPRIHDLMIVLVRIYLSAITDSIKQVYILA